MCQNFPNKQNNSSGFIFGLIFGLIVAAVAAVVIYKYRKSDVIKVLETKFKSLFDFDLPHPVKKKPGRKPKTVSETPIIVKKHIPKPKLFRKVSK